jgi:hypothetical protein
MLRIFLSFYSFKELKYPSNIINKILSNSNKLEGILIEASHKNGDQERNLYFKESIL